MYFEQVPEEWKLTITPRSYSARPKPLLLKAYVSQYFQDQYESKFGELPDLGLYRLRNCYVGPSGAIFSHNFKIYSAPDIHGRYFKDHIEAKMKDRNTDDAFTRAFSRTSSIVKVEGTAPVVAIGRPGYQVYGHWILDILPALWFFYDSQERHGIKFGSTKFLLPAGVPDWAFRMLNLMFGLKRDDFIEQDQSKLFHFDTLILPSMLRIEDYFSTEITRFSQFITDIFCRDGLCHSDPKMERLFITRSQAPSFIDRRIENLAELETEAEALGYRVIDPATLPWDEQVRLFFAARVIVGPFGSALHNAIFSSRDTKTLVIGGSYINGFQTGIAAAKGQEIAYLFPESEQKIDNRIVLNYDCLTLKNCIEALG